MALRAEGEMPLPAKLLPSPLCGPARVSGGEYARPFRKQPRKYPLDAYPLHHPLRAREKQRMSQSQTIRGSTGNFMAETAAARHSTPQKEEEDMNNELEEEWERKRMKYAATDVDTEAEALAVNEIMRFAELTGHGKAACFVGHWFYHGEGGLPQSPHDALSWYRRSAEAGFEGGLAARDRMYLDGTACGPDDPDCHAVAVQRLEELMESQERMVANAALATLRIWGLRQVESDQMQPAREIQDGGSRNNNTDNQSEFEESAANGVGSSAIIDVEGSQSEMRHEIVSSIGSTNPALAEELNRDKERLSLLRELYELERRVFPSDPSATQSTSSNFSVSSYGDGSAISTLQPLTPFGSAGRGSPPRRSSSPTVAVEAQERGGSEGGLRSAADVANAAPPPSEPRGIYEADRERALALQCILASTDYDSYMVMLETLKVNGQKKPAPSPLPDDAITYGLISRSTAKESLRLQALCNSYQPASTGYRLPKQSLPLVTQKRRTGSGLGSRGSSFRSLGRSTGDLEVSPLGSRGRHQSESFSLGNRSGGALLGTAPRNKSISEPSRKGGLHASTPARAHYTNSLDSPLPFREQRNLYTSS